jgi:hypothetical protein
MANRRGRAEAPAQLTPQAADVLAAALTRALTANLPANGAGSALDNLGGTESEDTTEQPGKSLVRRQSSEVVSLEQKRRAKLAEAERQRRECIRAGQKARMAPTLGTLATTAAGYCVWGANEVISNALGHPLGLGPELLEALAVSAASTSSVFIVKWANRDMIGGAHRRRYYVAGTVSSLWIVLSMFTGPGWVMLAILWTIQAVVAGPWLRSHAVERPVVVAPITPAGELPPPGENESEDGEGSTADVIALEDVGARWAKKIAIRNGGQVPGSKLTEGKRVDNVLEFSLQLNGGQILTDVQSRAERIASGLEMDPLQLVFDQPTMDGQWRNASKIRMQVVLDSPITNVVPFVKPMHRDGRILLGPYADGRGWAEYVLFSEDSMRNGVVIGSTGSGKSGLITGLVASARAMKGPDVKGVLRPIVAVAYLDPKQNSAPDLADNATVTELGLERAEEFTQAVEKLIELRGLESGINKWPGFTPTPERPGMLIVIDECDLLFKLPRMAERWAAIAKTGRALGVGLLLATQYAGMVAFGNSEMLRSNIAAGNVILMRTESNTSDRLIAPELPDSRSLPDSPGYGYLKAKDSRTAPFRAAYLPATHNAPDAYNAGVALRENPDADLALDRVARKAIELVMPPGMNRETKAEADRQRMAERLAKELGEPVTPPKAATQPTVADELDDMLNQLDNLGPVAKVYKMRPDTDEDTDLAAPSAPMGMDAVDKAWSDLSNLTENEQMVLDALLTGTYRSGDIVTSTSLSNSTVSKTLAQLGVRGLARKEGHGDWRPTRERKTA